MRDRIENNVKLGRHDQRHRRFLVFQATSKSPKRVASTGVLITGSSPSSELAAKASGRT
jgi:hypothetical protein